MVAQSITTPTMEPVIKTKGKIKLNPHSITIVSGKHPPNIDTSQVYELNHKFSLPSSVIPIDVMHTFDHKIPPELKISMSNTNNNATNIIKSTAIVSLRSAERVDNIFSLDLDTLFQTRQLAVEEVLDQQETQEQVRDLLPQISQTNLHLKLICPITQRSACPMQMFWKRH